MSTRRHPIAAPSAGRLAAVLGVGRVATGSPRGHELDEELKAQLKSQLESIHSPCIVHLRGSELEHVLKNMIEQLATNLATVVDGRTAVANPTNVELELDAFQTIWESLMDRSFQSPHSSKWQRKRRVRSTNSQSRRSRRRVRKRCFDS